MGAQPMTWTELEARLARGLGPLGWHQEGVDMSSHPVVQQALRNCYFDSVGLPRLAVFSNA